MSINTALVPSSHSVLYDEVGSKFDPGPSLQPDYRVPCPLDLSAL